MHILMRALCEADHVQDCVDVTDHQELCRPDSGRSIGSASTSPSSPGVKGHTSRETWMWTPLCSPLQFFKSSVRPGITHMHAHKPHTRTHTHTHIYILYIHIYIIYILQALTRTHTPHSFSYSSFNPVVAPVASKLLSFWIGLDLHDPPVWCPVPVGLSRLWLFGFNRRRQNKTATISHAGQEWRCLKSHWEDALHAGVDHEDATWPHANAPPHAVSHELHRQSHTVTRIKVLFIYLKY